MNDGGWSVSVVNINNNHEDPTNGVGDVVAHVESTGIGPHNIACHIQFGGIAFARASVPPTDDDDNDSNDDDEFRAVITAETRYCTTAATTTPSEWANQQEKTTSSTLAK